MLLSVLSVSLGLLVIITSVCSEKRIATSTRKGKKQLRGASEARAFLRMRNYFAPDERALSVCACSSSCVNFHQSRYQSLRTSYGSYSPKTKTRERTGAKSPQIVDLLYCIAFHLCSDEGLTLETSANLIFTAFSISKSTLCWYIPRCTASPTTQTKTSSHRD